ncbi:MAG: hypothetical protein KHZ24_03835 [Coriobacteriia bacterium]|nr:hypothetical protein [Coriobacteriia bacterium]
MSLAFFGTAFARTWLTLVFVDPGAVTRGGGAITPWPHAIFDLGFFAISFAIALLARKLVPLAARRGAWAATLAAMLAVSLVFSAGLWVELPTWVCVVLSVAGGAAYGAYLLLNGEVFVGVSLLRIVLYMAGSRVLSSALTWVVQACDAPRLAFVLAVMPFLAVGLSRAALATLAPSERQRAGYPRFAFPWKLIALVAVFSFAYGLRQSTLAAVGAGQHASFSTGLAMAVVFVATYFFSDRIDVARLCRLPLPVMLCGLLLVPTEGLFGGVVSSYLVSIGYTLMTLSIGVLFYDMSQRTGVAIVPLLAANQAMQIFIVLGNATSGVVGRLAPDAFSASLVVTVLTCLALVASFFLLFSERELEARWGIKVLSGGTLDDAAQAADDLAERCNELVRAYGLTSREAEVLNAWALRRDPATIAQSLSIAPGTLKAHTRHIYEKMGIHSREELYELLGLEWGTRE